VPVSEIRSTHPCENSYRRGYGQEVGLIRSIRIQNFQSHKDTTINLVDGMNVIAGSSESGKSSVIRAIEWVRTNRPVGLGYLRDGSDGPIAVTITFGDGRYIERIRSKSINKYVLGGNEGITETFDSVGTDVPARVLDLLAFDEHNTSSQFGKMYLVQSSPPAAARTINKLVGFDSLGVAAGIASSEIQSMSKEANEAEAEIERSKERLKLYDGLDDVGVLLDQAGYLAADADTVRSYADRLQHQVEVGEKVEGIAKIGDKELKADIEPLVSRCSDISLLLKELRWNIGRLDTDIEVLEGSAKRVDYESLATIDDLIESCDSAAANLYLMLRDIDLLGSRIEQVGAKHGEWEGAKAQLDGVIGMARDAASKLDACPLCNGEPIGDCPDGIINWVLGGS